MILAEDLLKKLNKKNISFFSGVPDSILKDFCNKLSRFNSKKHIVAVNEGSAVSLGMGYFLSKKKIPCIYMQNSGLGNAINPLISIADKKVYSIPMLLLIGWRGSPSSKDEPQHMTKGKITPDLLRLLNIKFCILKKKEDLNKLNKLLFYAKKNNRPVACLIEKNTLYAKKKIIIEQKKKYLTRNDFINKFLIEIPKKSKIISTTGYTSRELFQIRNKNKIINGKDFYMVGGMGHASIVSLGVSLNSNQQVFCIDGDGSLLMHMGSLRTNANFGGKNFKHIMLNNNAHESVGGQLTYANSIDFKNLTKSLGYKNYFKITKNKNNKLIIKKFINSLGPSFLEVIIKTGSIKNLIRPGNLLKIKKNFIK